MHLYDGCRRGLTAAEKYLGAMRGDQGCNQQARAEHKKRNAEQEPPRPAFCAGTHATSVAEKS
jgi:hypothetical protein